MPMIIITNLIKYKPLPNNNNPYPNKFNPNRLLSNRHRLNN